MKFKYTFKYQYFQKPFLQEKYQIIKEEKNYKFTQNSKFWFAKIWNVLLLVWNFKHVRKLQIKKNKGSAFL